ncbi:carbohydrate ABC transporter substrate-binding protein, partial [[Clostridium] symbiosum]|nr:carbohydrate ABC transporter substrate-binding protein [[Clostridium] symbiosum]
MAAGLLAGCGSNKSDSASGESSKDDKGTVYYLSFKPEQAEQWEAIAKAYTEETGVQVKVQTAASGT